MNHNMIPLTSETAEIQTRGHDHEQGIINYFVTLFLAYEYWRTVDPTVWKISYTGTDGKTYRWIPFTKGSNRLIISEPHLCAMSDSYKNCTDTNMIFWVNKPLSDPEFVPGTTILTDAQFRALF